MGPGLRRDDICFVAFAPRRDGGWNRTIDASTTPVSSIDIEENILSNTIITSIS
jgi:hypothetical protein